MIYEPREDSFLLERVAVKHAKRKNVLDMGTGSGIIGFACISAGAQAVTFADISKEAILPLQNKGLQAVQSDLFSNIHQKFDLIVFNPPYLPEDSRESQESALATSGGKRGDEIVCRFIQQVSNHLNPDGVILLLLSSLTPRERFDSLCNKFGFTLEKVASEKFQFEEIYVLSIRKQNSFKARKEG